MGRIIRLDPHLSNMIAAGEVVERVGNVVKELLENALDAGAKHIDVSLRESGLAQIRVADNGSGMDRDDAVLAFERHATSKIRTERDLFRIGSLGFRGEALPSIAAVANVELVTSTGAAEGWRVFWRDGALVASGLSAAAPGTTVSVTKLFHNTPARLKFVKSTQAELAFIAELVDKYALTRPDVAFRLENDGKVLLSTSGRGDLRAVLAAIYGVAAAKEMRPFAAADRDYRVSGMLSSPLVNRASRGYVTVSVNGRVIRSAKAVQAIVDGYGQTLPHGRFPIVTAEIATDPSLLDVNVHPTKLEVRFSEEGALWALLARAIRETLAGVRLIQPAERPEPVRTAGDDTVPATLPSGDGTDLFTFEERPSEFVHGPSSAPLPAMDYIGQYAGTYLVLQNPEGLHLVDQHAAAERIRYERYAKAMAVPPTAIYRPILAVEVAFSVHDAVRIAAGAAEFARLGVEIQPGENGVFAVTAVPAWLPRGMEAELVGDMGELLIADRPLSTSAMRDALAKSLSCKRSIRANRHLNENEVTTLMKDLAACENPYTCPHGRPVVVRIALREIEKWFRRVL